MTQKTAKEMLEEKVITHDEQFRMILSHAFLGSDTSDIDRQTWDLAINGCVKYLESQLALLSPQIEEQRQEIERLKEELAMTEMADITFAGSEAIEFGEWIIDNFFYPDIISQEKKWVAKNVNNPFLGFYGTATTAQLYDKYKIWSKQEFDKKVNERKKLNSEQNDKRSV